MASLAHNTARVLDLTAYGQKVRQRDPLALTEISRPSAELDLMLTALNALQHHVAFLDRMGRPKQATQAYLRLISDTIDGEAIQARVRDMVQNAWGLMSAGRLGGGVQPLVECRLTTPNGEYRIRTAYMAQDLGGAGPSVMATIEPPAPDPLAIDRLCSRFGLTRAQARVAQLLGRGMRNKEMAMKLFLSPHTVRHHIEQIRHKVGGNSRAALATRLREECC